MNKRLMKLELWGILFTILAGTALHFAFAWSGDWRPVGVFAAVNESVWEHLKLAFWPSLAWAVFETYRLKEFRSGFWFGKATGIILMPLIVVAVFYTYTSFTGHPVLPVDISTFVVAVVIGYTVSCRLISAGKGAGRTLSIAGATMLVLVAVAFGLFTFQPPHIGIFRDTSVGGYGILK